jgi:DNA-binding SARP family transcriptional activator/tetratricopeptide (TPR) repeat protein
MTNVEIQCLGRFEVKVDGRSVPATAWRHRKAAGLVKLLALASGNRLHREQVIESLWPHLSPDAGDRNLHKAIHLARKEIGDPAAITLSSQEVGLGDVVAVDVERFESEAGRALGAADPGSCASVASQYTGELLPEDRYEEWTQPTRERLHILYAALLRCAERWSDLLEIEPLDEEAHRALIRAYAEAGNRAAALRQFARLKGLLGKELGLRPAPESVALYEEIARGPAAVAPVAFAAPMVGRERELASAMEALRHLDAGRGGGLLVSGEAGIGKTRLCDALLAEASAAGRTTLRGATRVEEGALPYAPVAEAVDRLLLERPDLAALLSEGAQIEIARLTAASPAPMTEADPGTVRRRLFSAVAQLLSAAAHERGAVVLLEDLHAADEATVQLAHYLVRAARFQPLLVVLSYRAESISPALAQVRASLLVEGVTLEIALGPLARDAAASIVEQVHGDVPPVGAIDAIWGKAEGNPFFIQELASAIEADGTIVVPERLYDILQARLLGLDAGLRAALERAAIVGEEFSADEFEAISELDELAAFDALDQGLATGFIVESSDGYRFAHSLLREALIYPLPAHRRAQLHRSAAEALSAAGAPPGRVAHHLLEGGRAVEAVPWLERAAASAAAVAAYADALALTERALQHAGGGDRTRLLALRADLLFAVGDPTAPIAYGEAIAAAKGRARVSLRIRQSRAYLAAGDAAAAQAALNGVEATTLRDRASLLLARGLVAWHDEDLADAQTAAEEARRLASDAGLVGVAAEASGLLGMVSHSRGQLWDRVRSDVLDTARNPGLAGSVFDAYLCLVEFSLYGAEPYEEIAGFARELRASADRAGAVRGAAFAATVLGEAELLSGQLDQAEEHLREADGLGRQSHADASRSLALERLAEVALAAGRPEQAQAPLADALVLAQVSTLAGHLLPRIYGAAIRAAGDSAAASDVLAQAEGAFADTPTCTPCSIGFLLAASTSCAHTGDLERASSYVDRASGVAGMWGEGAWTAGVAEARAEVLIARAEPREAVLLLGEASDLFGRAGQPLDEARCRVRAEEISSRKPPRKNRGRTAP